MNFTSHPSSTSSLASTQRNETFDEKTHRFNAYAEILTSDRRVFVVQELALRTFFAWEQIYLVDIELLEKREQYPLAFQITIRWEEMFGHEALPGENALCRMARASIGAYLESHRFTPCVSTHHQVVRLQLPEPEIEAHK